MSTRHYPNDNCGDPNHDAILVAWYKRAEEILDMTTTDTGPRLAAIRKDCPHPPIERVQHHVYWSSIPPREEHYESCAACGGRLTQQDGTEETRA